MNLNTNTGQVSITGLPDKCPFCHKSIRPNPLFGYKNGRDLDVLMYCPDSTCESAFIAYYYLNSNNGVYSFFDKVSQGKLIGRDFTNTISEISPMFVEIYNQSYTAEQQNLTEICGVGYRKALEFLIKDYSILNHPSEKEKIEKKLLGACINDYVTDSRIKSVAKRAVWIGNDETHYIRKWEGKNLSDLKKLIDLTLHWVEMEKLTESFETEMPD
ncbi:hypothetical protein [Tenacibaculum sp.]|uniref:hypothetical protein n=1 Tax=Tenacibaculum sp. TaxID=1906242 RepID=UPI003D09CD94